MSMVDKVLVSFFTHCICKCFVAMKHAMFLCTLPMQVNGRDSSSHVFLTYLRNKKQQTAAENDRKQQIVY